MKLIGITGLKTSGKTALAQFLETALLPSSVAIVSFADALKDEVALATGNSREFIEANKKNFRLILQGWGTDFRRELCSKDYWVTKLLTKALAYKRNGVEYLIIPDVRFQNEADAITNVDGYLIRVVRKAVESNDMHPSEMEQRTLKVHQTIQNDFSLEHLRQAAINTVKQLKQ